MTWQTASLLTPLERRTAKIVRERSCESGVNSILINLLFFPTAAANRASIMLTH